LEPTSLGLVFAVSYAVAFAVLATVVGTVRAVRRRNRRTAFQAILRARSMLYAQMNALLGEFHRLARMDRDARLEAVSPEPGGSATGTLFADVAQRLQIVSQEVDPGAVPKQLAAASGEFAGAVHLLLEGLQTALAATTPQAFLQALPKAAPTVAVEPLRRADVELKAFADAEGIDSTDFFYQDASFYV
jgi:hypothetical protein